jgi:type I restriction enzyme S subunit
VRRWKRYDVYKDSGDSLIGVIPAAWKTAALKRFVEVNRPITYGIVQPGDLDPAGRFMVRGQDYSTGWSDPDKLFRVSSRIEEPYRRSRLRPDDLVMTIVGAGVGNVAKVPNWLDGSNITQTTARIAIDKSIAVPDYIRYVLTSRIGRSNVTSYVKGAAQPGLNLYHVELFKVPGPPIQEQRDIVSFLDRETARISALIGHKERLIALLEEKRQTVISHTVTCGLDPSPPVKDSGIPWLGMVPEHWTMTRLKFVAEIQSGLTLGKDYGERPLVERPYLRVANVQDGFLDLEEITTVQVPIADVSRHELRPGDVLMTEGGDFDKLGRGYVWEGQIQGCLHQNHVFAVRPIPNRLRSHYLSAVMTSAHGRNYFTFTSQQSTNLASTNATKLGNFPIPLPNADEQNRILAAISERSDVASRTLDRIRDGIARLHEYRIALVSAAVTGQIDVRGEVNS